METIMKNYEAPQIVELGNADALVLGDVSFPVQDNPGEPDGYQS
jgi:hypothetical protein